MEREIAPTSRSWLYFSLALGWTWLLLLPAVLAGLDAGQGLTTLLRVLAGLGPALSALYILYALQSPENRSDYWRRLVSFRRIRGRWWIFALLTPVILVLISGVLDVLFGGSGIRLESGLPGPGQPLAWLGLGVFILFFGPVPEEMGWRGIALDDLQIQWGSFLSSVILGAFWALWHLPLFWIEGTYQADLGLFTPEFFMYLLMMIPESILITWIYNNTRRSTLSAVLFHFAINLTGEVFWISRSGNWIYSGLWILAAGWVVCR